MATLRPRNSVTADPIRPAPRDPNKKLGLFKRMMTSKKSRNNGGINTSSNANNNTQQPASATTLTTVSSFATIRAPSSRSSRKHRTIVKTSSSKFMNWLQNDCPQDLLPKILAFAGPQKTAAMSRTNRFWHDVVEQESTWRTLCEDLYKWKEGDAIPDSWRDYYKYNPCVPVDFSTVNSAFSVAKGPHMAQLRSIRVLLRPGRYILREAITIEAPFAVRVAMETMEMPASFRPIIETPAEVEPAIATRRRKAASLRNILACRNVEVEDPEEDPLPELVDTVPQSSTAPSFKRATLTLRTRKPNEPIIRVRQGRCMLRNLALRHYSNGIDIWNGNSAVQIQPPLGPDDHPVMVVPAPTAILDRVEVASASGRGIVNIDGGHVVIRNCYVHDCAATGVYVGGPGSRAFIEHTDVVRNGGGNTRHRRGIARGHSGIYLEQGLAHIKDCNVSQNSLTGISAVSSENAILNLEESELISNGTFQLEMPAIGSTAHRRSFTQNNTLASTGFPRSRSRLALED